VAPSSLGRPLRRAHGIAHRWLPRLPRATAGTDVAAAALGAEVVTVLGDSHALVFRAIARQHLVPKTWFDLVVVRGATARGLINPNSATDARRRFHAALRPVPRTRKTVVMLGEVDCGFLVWHRSQERGTSVDAELDQSLRAHTDFLDGLLESGRRRLCVVSAIVPTVWDYATWAGLSNRRKEVRAGIHERTAATVAYNARLRAWADARDVPYLDLDRVTLDASTGVVRECFRNSDAQDHHLDRNRLAAAIAEEMSSLTWPPPGGERRPVR